MIRVNDNYVIEVDPYNYTPKENLHRTDKNGDPLFKTIGYYNNLRSAVKGVLDYDIKKSLSDGDKSLYEAVRVLNEAYSRLDKLINSIQI